MDNVEFTEHALEMLHERKIPKAWVFQIIDKPSIIEHDLTNKTIHYIGPVQEFGNRKLRVIVSPLKEKMVKVITVFFDRRLGTANEA
jgi:Domain of unknown function (DUF4258)